MVKNIQIIVTVLIRLIGLLIVTFALISGLMLLLVSSTSTSLAEMAISMIVGAVVWFLAKPCADIVTLGLEE